MVQSTATPTSAQRPAGSANRPAPRSGGSPADSRPRFVQNTWYIAALRSEVERKLLARTILGRSVALYRTRSGRVVALRNRCTHRGYPLSAGTLGDDDVITCGYHGFQFDSEGVCLKVPAQDNVPGGADVRSYPVVENGPFVWIWMGDPALADPAEIPPETGFADPSFQFVSGHVVIDAHHELIADNVLDLSHESFIHATKIGTREVAETGITTETDESRWLVRASRIMRDVECPPTYRRRTGLESPIDREQHINFFAPALYVLDTMVVAAESRHDPADGPRRPYLGKVVYGLTPLSDKRTHYFFAIGRDYAHDDPKMDADVHEGQLCLIEEDADAVAILQRMADEEGVPPEVSIRLDTAALIGRRMTARRLRAEATAD